MEKKIFRFGALLVASLSGLLLFSSFAGHGAGVSSDPPASPILMVNQRITAFDLDKTFVFAGEAIPAGNFDAIERLDRELLVNTYQHSATLLNLKQAYRYFPVIEPILAKHGIPDDFKYLCVAESNLRMATSSAGAKGLWQFMESTGRAYGLEISESVDERYHVEKSTEAACRFLSKLKDRFGSWTLAAAAYNMGEGGLARRIGQQQVDNYYDLHLPDETSRYVFRIHAIKEIMSNPSKYGFYLDKNDLYPELENYRVITVNESVDNWGDFAKEHNTTYRMLKIYNPWLRDSKLTVIKNTYKVKVPV